MQIKELLRKSPFSTVNHYDSQTGTMMTLEVQAHVGAEMVFNTRSTNLALVYQFLDTSSDDTAAINDPLVLVNYVTQFVDPTKNSLYSAWVLDQYERGLIKQADFSDVRTMLNLFKSTGKEPAVLNSMPTMNDLYQFIQTEHGEMFKHNRSVKESLANAGVSFLNVHEHSSAQYAVLVSQEDSEGSLGSVLKDRALTGRDYGDFKQAIVVKSLNGETYHFQEEFPEVIYRSDGAEQEFKSIPVDAQRLFFYSWACAGMQQPLQDYFQTDVTTARATLPGLRSAMLDISPDSRSFACQELYFQMLDDPASTMNLLNERQWNLRQLSGLVKNPVLGAEIFENVVQSLSEIYVDGAPDDSNDLIRLDRKTHDLAEEYPSEVFTELAKARLSNPAPLSRSENDLMARIIVQSDGCGEILSLMGPAQIATITPTLLKDINQCGYLSLMQISSELARHPDAKSLHKDFCQAQATIAANNESTQPDVRKLFGRSIDHFSSLVAKGKVDPELIPNILSSEKAKSHAKLHSAMIQSPLVPMQSRVDLVSESNDTAMLRSLVTRSPAMELRHALENRLSLLQQNNVKTGVHFVEKTNASDQNKNLTNENHNSLEFNHIEKNQLSALASEEIKALVERLEDKNGPGNTQ